MEKLYSHPWNPNNGYVMVGILYKTHYGEHPDLGSKTTSGYQMTNLYKNRGKSGSTVDWCPIKCFVNSK